MAKKNDGTITLEDFNGRMAELGVDENTPITIIDHNCDESKIESVQHDYDTGAVRVYLSKVESK
jgi:hypothetical protein